jgi:hypothetical protein
MDPKIRGMHSGTDALHLVRHFNFGCANCRGSRFVTAPSPGS